MAASLTNEEKSTLFYDIEREKDLGVVTEVSRSLVIATVPGVGVHEIVRIGADQLLGQVIVVDEGTARIVPFESISGLQPGDPVVRTYSPLMVELGPGLLGQMYDGIQRPFKDLSEGGTKMYLPHGANAAPLDRKKLWEFTPTTFKVGDHITGGDVFGKVYETPLVTHWIMLPPQSTGIITYIAPHGHYTITEEVLAIDSSDSSLLSHTSQSFTMTHKWPARQRRPVPEKLPCDTLLYSGIRILDSFFPLAQGGTCVIPGAFGTGKGEICKSIAKYSNSDVVVYVACGERGNELADISSEFSEITVELGRNSHEVMKRTCIVASTSSMPLGQRGAAVNTGITIAEYFRDQGHNSTLITDSTSRWMEEAWTSLNPRGDSTDFPVSFHRYHLSNFYERAGKVICLGNPGRTGSLSIVATVSPPGGDFGDPLTSYSISLCRNFWLLDKKLAYSRHFPAVSWSTSNSGYINSLSSFFLGQDPDYAISLSKVKDIMALYNDLQEIINLIGRDPLGEPEKLTIKVAEMIIEAFMLQDIYSQYDQECPLYKMMWMVKNITIFFELSMRVVERNVTVVQILSSAPTIMSQLRRMKYLSTRLLGREVVESKLRELYQNICAHFCIFSNQPV